MAEIFTPEDQLMFGQVREDAAVEVMLVNEVQEPKRILIIASGGCTALSLIANGTYLVDALDISAAQIAFVKQKVKVFERETYYNVLDKLKSMNVSGAVDQKMRKFSELFHTFVHPRKVTQTFLNESDVNRQSKFYKTNWRNWKWNLALKLAFNGTFLAAAKFPAAQQLVPGSFSNIMEERFEHAMTKFPNNTNPYLWQTLLAQYPDRPEGLPFYMQQDNYSKIVANLKNLSLHCDGLLEWLTEQEPGSIDFFGLSNVLEVLPDHFADAIAQQIVRCGKPGALIITRTIFPRRHATFAHQNLQQEEELEKRAQSIDRSLFCNFIEVYRLKS
jgi:S-adenosylmethionine:diacylglycerol 3-amino-3-carboxypropyl transferase